jgi:hypothetical protein
MRFLLLLIFTAAGFANGIDRILLLTQQSETFKEHWNDGCQITQLPFRTSSLAARAVFTVQVLDKMKEGNLPWLAEQFPQIGTEMIGELCLAAKKTECWDDEAGVLLYLLIATRDWKLSLLSQIIKEMGIERLQYEFFYHWALDRKKFPRLYSGEMSIPKLQELLKYQGIDREVVGLIAILDQLCIDRRISDLTEAQGDLLLDYFHEREMLEPYRKFRPISLDEVDFFGFVSDFAEGDEYALKRFCRLIAPFKVREVWARGGRLTPAMRLKISDEGLLEKCVHQEGDRLFCTFFE